MKAVFSLLAALLVVLCGAGAASALETGTPAWTTKAVTLQNGPGPAYDFVGDVEGEQRIYVERCSGLWCQIRAGHARGWTSKQYISFGQEPRGPFTGPRLDYNSGGPGTVCLYEGSGYTGRSICGGSGFVVRDLLLHREDNIYSSVAIEGNVSVTLCRDRHFKSYCERYNESAPTLDGFLNNAVTSMRVY